MIGFVLPLFPSLNGNLVIKYSMISFTLKNLSRDLPGHFLLSKTCCSSNQVSKELFWLLLLVVTQTRPRPSAATQDISKCIPRHTTQPQRADEKNMCSHCRKKKKIAQISLQPGKLHRELNRGFISVQSSKIYIYTSKYFFFFFLSAVQCEISLEACSGNCNTQIILFLFDEIIDGWCYRTVVPRSWLNSSCAVPFCLAKIAVWWHFSRGNGHVPPWTFAWIYLYLKNILIHFKCCRI